jgi:hypothetical protein
MRSTLFSVGGNNVERVGRSVVRSTNFPLVVAAVAPT